MKNADAQAIVEADWNGLDELTLEELLTLPGAIAEAEHQEPIR